MGSDWSVSSPNPIWEMHIAVERKAPVEYAGDRPVFLPDERLDLIDALAAFTNGSAYVNHLDDETGTLEVGKLADLAVLDRDLFDRGAGPIMRSARRRDVRRGRAGVRGPVTGGLRRPSGMDG